MSQVKKECCQTDANTKEHRVQYYFNHYGTSVKVVDDLFDEVLKDFPDVKSDDVNIIVFGGDSKKYVLGLRFSVKLETIPEGIFDWSKNLKDQEYMSGKDADREWRRCWGCLDEVLFQ